MISDVICECIVKKEAKKSDYIKMILLGSGIILIGAILFVLLSWYVRDGAMVGIFAFAAAIWIGVRTFQKLRTEYEYTIVNNDMTVDSIINMSRRKRLLSIDTKSIEELGVYDPQRFNASRFDKCWYYASSADSENAIYAYYKDAESGNKYCVILERSDKLLSTLRKCVSSNAYRMLNLSR